MTRPRKSSPHGHAGHALGAHHPGALPQQGVLAEEDDAGAVLPDVLYHALDAVFKQHDLAVADVVDAGDPGDAVAQVDHRAHLLALRGKVEAAQLLLHHGDHGVLVDHFQAGAAQQLFLQGVQLALAAPVVFFVPGGEDEACHQALVLHQGEFHLAAGLLGGQKGADLVQLGLVGGSHIGQTGLERRLILRCH